MTREKQVDHAIRQGAALRVRPKAMTVMWSRRPNPS
jgi:Cu/Ag efflux pump CusA